MGLLAFPMVNLSTYGMFSLNSDFNLSSGSHNPDRSAGGYDFAIDPVVLEGHKTYYWQIKYAIKSA